MSKQSEPRAREYTLVLANITYKDGYEAVDQLYGSVMWSIEHDGVERSYPTSDAVASLYSAGQYAEVERLRAEVAMYKEDCKKIAENSPTIKSIVALNLTLTKAGDVMAEVWGTGHCCCLFDVTSKEMSLITECAGCKASAVWAKAKEGK